MTPQSATAIRIAIPFLRFLTWYKALWIISYPQFISYAIPLQKQFVIPLASYMWGVLSLLPFILLRFRPFYIFYIITLSTLLVILAYDYFIPFGYPEGIPAIGNAKSTINDEVVYWTSQPGFSNIDVFMAIIFIAPLPLAVIYRRYFPQWAKQSYESQ